MALAGVPSPAVTLDGSWRLFSNNLRHALSPSCLALANSAAESAACFWISASRSSNNTASSGRSWFFWLKSSSIPDLLMCRKIKYFTVLSNYFSLKNREIQKMTSQVHTEHCGHSGSWQFTSSCKHHKNFMSSFHLKKRANLIFLYPSPLLCEGLSLQKKKRKKEKKTGKDPTTLAHIHTLKCTCTDACTHTHMRARCRRWELECFAMHACVS